MSEHNSNGHIMPIRAAKVDKNPHMTIPSRPKNRPEGIKKPKKAYFLRKFNLSGCRFARL